MGTETGSALGLAVFGTLVATFTTGNFGKQLSAAGVSSDKVTQAVNTLKSAIQGSLQKPYPQIDPNILSKLEASIENAYTDAIIMTLIISAILIFITAGLVWVGMRGRADQPLTDDTSEES